MNTQVLSQTGTSPAIESKANRLNDRTQSAGEPQGWFKQLRDALGEDFAWTGGHTAEKFPDTEQ